MYKAREIEIHVKVEDNWQTKLYHVDEEIWGPKLDETKTKPELTTEVLYGIVQAADDDEDESSLLYSISWD